MKKKLGVNIDHVATIRNYPSPLKAALIAQKYGADSVTIHLREDRRHIRDNDLKIFVKKIRIPINLEIAPTKEMLKIAIKYKPNYVCIVPEKRAELTTEGGLNLKRKYFFLKKMIKLLKNHKIRISLFIEPNVSDIYLSKSLGADCVELHTGRYCNKYNKNASSLTEFKKLKKTSFIAKKMGLEVHAGHGLTYVTTKKLTKIKEISEYNIGHFIVSESIFLSLGKVIKKIKNIINKK